MTVQTSPITQFPGGPVDAPVAAAAKLRGATPAQILLAWVKAKGAVIVTSVAYRKDITTLQSLTKNLLPCRTSSKRKRLEEYLAAADIGKI